MSIVKKNLLFSAIIVVIDNVFNYELTLIWNYMVFKAHIIFNCCINSFIYLFIYSVRMGLTVCRLESKHYDCVGIGTRHFPHIKFARSWPSVVEHNFAIYANHTIATLSSDDWIFFPINSCYFASFYLLACV